MDDLDGLSGSVVEAKVIEASEVGFSERLLVEDALGEAPGNVGKVLEKRTINQKGDSFFRENDSHCVALLLTLFCFDLKRSIGHDLAQSRKAKVLVPPVDVSGDPASPVQVKFR